jgi:hypothetical protein
VAGGLLGGTAGAVIGSNVAARNARTEGALLGGLLGVIAGAAVGNHTAACTSQGYSSASPPPPPPRVDSRYYDRDAYAAAEAREDARAAAREDARAAVRDEEYAYGQRGERYRLSERAPGPDGCTLAESPIYMPDGRTQTRFVRVCRDSTGRYAVVD